MYLWGVLFGDCVRLLGFDSFSGSMWQPFWWFLDGFLNINFGSTVAGTVTIAFFVCFGAVKNLGYQNTACGSGKKRRWSLLSSRLGILEGTVS